MGFSGAVILRLPAGRRRYVGILSLPTADDLLFILPINIIDFFCTFTETFKISNPLAHNSVTRALLCAVFQGCHIHLVRNT